MNLSLYVTVAEAAKLANVTAGYIRIVLAKTDGAGPGFRGQKVGRDWLVLREDAVRFERKPGMGRPKKTKKAAKRKPRQGR
jgi:hypothetical protein